MNKFLTLLMQQASHQRFNCRLAYQVSLTKLAEFNRVGRSLKQPSKAKALLVALSLALIPCISIGANPLKITSEVWSQIVEEDRNALIRLYAVEILPPSSVGKIVDAQVVNESTSGTNAGSMIGGAVGSAAYIDRSFRGNNNYSAMGHLGVSLLGMVVGGIVDQPARSQFHTRYTIKMPDGTLKYHDEISASQFRKSVGDCVNILEWQSLNTNLCEANTEYFKKLIPKTQIGNGSVNKENFPEEPNPVRKVQPNITGGTSSAVSKQSSIEVNAVTSQGEAEVICKIGSTMPIKISQKDCFVSNGVILQ